MASLASAIEIPLTKGFVALIDARDAHLAQHKWSARVRPGKTVYAHRAVRVADGRKKDVLLHRAVLGVTDPKVEVDHKDGNGLDCRRANLRVATGQQNRANRRPNASNTSGFKGVCWHKGSRRWAAQIKVYGRKIHLGKFKVAADAARAYDAAAREAFGEFAWLNFPAEAAA